MCCLINCFRYYQVGHVNELLGNYRQSIEWLEIVHMRAMHDAGILAMLGSLYAKCDDEPKALHHYNESHRVYPSNMDITSWLGTFYVKNEVYEKAMPFFDLASKIQPTEVVLHNIHLLIFIYCFVLLIWLMSSLYGYTSFKSCSKNELPMFSWSEL